MRLKASTEYDWQQCVRPLQAFLGFGVGWAVAGLQGRRIAG
jgi:hypothetical protein